jgi:lysophospholipase L1-like esterase
LRNIGGGEVRVKVDGQYVSLAPSALPSNWAGLLTIDFSSVGGDAARTIEVECWLCAPNQIAIGPTDSLYLPRRSPDEPCLYVIGDSFTYGSAATEPGFTSLVETIRAVTGIEDLIVDGVGSTGYKRTTGSGGNDYLSRVTAYGDVLATAGAVLFLGSVNDSIYTASQVQAQAAACFAQVRPLPVYAVVMASEQPTPAGQTAVRDGVQAAMAAAPNAGGFLDLTGVLTGTGYGGHTTGTGNSDVLRSSDGTHPTQAGHDLYGRMIGDWLNEVLPR